METGSGHSSAAVSDDMTDANQRSARIGERTWTAPTDTSRSLVQPVAIPGKGLHLIRMEVLHRVPGAAAQRPQEVRSYQHGDVVMGAKKLRRLEPALYAALYRADRIWLRYHQPERERVHRAIRVDWQARDNTLNEQLKTAYISLIGSADRPRQITLAALGRKVGARALLEKHLGKLPECRRFVQDVSEDRVQFALRRLGYTAAMMRSAGVTPLAWKLLIGAGIRADLAENQIIVDYVEELVRGNTTVREQHQRDGRKMNWTGGAEEPKCRTICG
jgi:hypothetical protein